MFLKKSVKIGEHELSIETGKMAKQADGAVVVRYGDTMILTTAVSAQEKKDVDFLPLTVEYQEKLYSAGRIPGSYFRREGRLTEKETLTSRLVDRSCRPLFPDVSAYETQVIAGIRVGRVGGQLIANPSAKQRAESDLDLVMACSKDAIVMVEGGASEVSEADMVAAVAPVLEMQEAMRRELGVQVREYDRAPAADESLRARVRELATPAIVAGYKIHEKHDRYGALSQA